MRSCVSGLVRRLLFSWIADLAPGDEVEAWNSGAEAEVPTYLITQRYHAGYWLGLGHNVSCGLPQQGSIGFPPLAEDKVISSILPPSGGPCQVLLPCSPTGLSPFSRSVIALCLDLKQKPSFAALGGYGSGRWEARCVFLSHGSSQRCCLTAAKVLFRGSYFSLSSLDNTSMSDPQQSQRGLFSWLSRLPNMLADPSPLPACRGTTRHNVEDLPDD